MARLGLAVAFAASAGLGINGSVRGDVPPPGTMNSPIRIWVDQIGYRAAAPKMAVVASDKALPDGLKIELHSEKDNAVVWKLADHPAALLKVGGGNKDRDSGDYIDQVEFGEFAAPGRYYFVLAEAAGPASVRSYKFNIAANPYHEAGLAAWKALYYARADGDKLEKYGGLWNHGPAFLGPHQATEAQVYKWKTGNRWPDQVGTEIVDPKTYDVHGGWWDAGDFNKYTSNTVTSQNQFLMAYEMAAGGPKDRELNIPESGHGVPDVLDQIRVATEFLIRDHDGTGAAFGRVHQESGSPPETVKAVVQLTMPNSATTMARAAGLAYAAVVWRESTLDDAFAKTCLDESMRSWNLLKTKPHPWPVDPKNPNQILSQGEMGGDDKDYAVWRATAAACYFRLTSQKEYDQIVHDAVAKGVGDVAEPYKWVYMRSKGADPDLVAKIKKAVADSATGILGQQSAKGYRLVVDGFWWGSNAHVGSKGGTLVLAALLTDDAAKKKAYLEGAEEYVHYLNGRNPRGECYFSNMKSFGAEHSAVVMFHGWVGNATSKYSQKYIGEGPGKIGPFPGYIIGGPNGSMKKLIEDEDLDWRKAPWEFTEPDIGYQSQVMRLMSGFIW